MNIEGKGSRGACLYGGSTGRRQKDSYKIGRNIEKKENDARGTCNIKRGKDAEGKAYMKEGREGGRRVERPDG